MNGDELKDQQTKRVWINLNPHERLSSRMACKCAQHVALAVTF